MSSNDVSDVMRVGGVLRSLFVLNLVETEPQNVGHVVSGRLGTNKVKHNMKEK